MKTNRKSVQDAVLLPIAEADMLDQCFDDGYFLKRRIGSTLSGEIIGVWSGLLIFAECSDTFRMWFEALAGRYLCDGGA